MAQYEIQASNVKGEFEAVSVETGQVFRNKQGRTSFSMRGLRQALTKGGHTEVGRERDTIPAPAPKAEKTFKDSTAYKLGYTPELCDEVYAWVRSQREAGNKAKFKELAESIGHTSDGFAAAFRVGKARRLANMDPQVLAERKAKAQARKEGKEARKVEATPGNWDAEAANKCARLHGFNTKRPYRACRRAAANGDTFAALVREVCVQVAQGKQALPKQPVIRKAG